MVYLQGIINVQYYKITVLLKNYWIKNLHNLSITTMRNYRINGTVEIQFCSITVLENSQN